MAVTNRWGVKPDSGLEVLLTADEIEAYHAERRQRDAIVAHTADQPATAAAKYDKQLQVAFDQLLKLMDKDVAQKQP